MRAVQSERSIQNVADAHRSQVECRCGTASETGRGGRARNLPLRSPFWHSRVPNEGIAMDCAGLDQIGEVSFRHRPNLLTALSVIPVHALTSWRILRTQTGRRERKVRQG